MRHDGFLLAWEKNGWRIAKCDGDGCSVKEVSLQKDADLAEIARQLSEALQEMGYRGQGVCLGLPADVVLTAQIECGGLPRKDRRSAMLFRLEEQLPVEAERLTADFVTALNGRSLGVAAETSAVKPVIDALERSDVEIAAACPTAMLSLWDSCGHGTSDFDYAVICESSGVSLFRLSSGQPVSWQSVPDDPDQLALFVQADVLRDPPEGKPQGLSALLVGQLSQRTIQSLEKETSVRIVRSEHESAIVPASRAAAALLSGKRAGWVNLRRDGLGSPDPWRHVARPAKCATVLGLLLLASLAGTFHWRASRYEALARQSHERQVAVYDRLYPNTKVPPNVNSRLKSECARLLGVSGTESRAPHEPNALDTLRLVVTNLPSAIRLRIDRLRVEPQAIQIEGEARTHSDAERIAQSLQQGGLSINAPRTEYLSRGGVGFRISGKPSQAAADPPESGGPR